MDRNRDGKQSSSSSTTSSVPPDPDLVVGSMVEVLLQGKPPLYGVIKWIGTFDDQTNKVIAGLEMVSHKNCISETYAHICLQEKYKKMLPLFFKKKNESVK